jgi:hypothetical protein
LAAARAAARRFILSDKIARQKTRFFAVLTPPAAMRLACPPGGQHAVRFAF